MKTTQTFELDIELESLFGDAPAPVEVNNVGRNINKSVRTSPISSYLVSDEQFGGSIDESQLELLLNDDIIKSLEETEPTELVDPITKSKVIPYHLTESFNEAKAVYEKSLTQEGYLKLRSNEFNIKRYNAFENNICEDSSKVLDAITKFNIDETIRYRLKLDVNKSKNPNAPILTLKFNIDKKYEILVYDNKKYEDYSFILSSLDIDSYTWKTIYDGKLHKKSNFIHGKVSTPTKKGPDLYVRLIKNKGNVFLNFNKY